MGSTSFREGTPYDLSTLKREEDGTGTLDAGYASFPADSGNRLKFSPEAADYFGADGSVGLEASRRIRGTVLHGILSRVKVADDLPEAVDAAVRSGELPADAREDTLALLRERLDSVSGRGWFAPDARVLSEAGVIGPDGREYRPDRVVVHPDGSIDVVDYKFGSENPSYHRQVQRYMNLYRQMGHAKVAGYLWYLEDNFITFVG